MATAPVTIKLSLEVSVEGDGTVNVQQSTTPTPPTAALGSEWDPTTAGGIRKFKLFAGVGPEVLGYVVIVDNNVNPPDGGYVVGRDHWVWTGAAWIDCFRMESTIDAPPALANVAVDAFPVNVFGAATATVPAGQIDANQRLWQAARREANGTITDLNIYLHKHVDANNVLNLDFYAHPTEVNTANFLIWSGSNAYFWTRRFTGPTGASGYRKVAGLKQN